MRRRPVDGLGMAAETDPTRSMVVRLSERSGQLIATPAGPHLGEREAGVLKSEVEAALTRQLENLEVLVLDFSQVASMSSVGLGVCIDLRHRAAASQARTMIRALNPQLTDLFRMVRVDRLFEFGDVDSDSLAA